MLRPKLALLPARYPAVVSALSCLATGAVPGDDAPSTACAASTAAAVRTAVSRHVTLGRRNRSLREALVHQGRMHATASEGIVLRPHSGTSQAARIHGVFPEVSAERAAGSGGACTATAF